MISGLIEIVSKLDVRGLSFEALECDSPSPQIGGWKISCDDQSLTSKIIIRDAKSGEDAMMSATCAHESAARLLELKYGVLFGAATVSDQALSDSSGSHIIQCQMGVATAFGFGATIVVTPSAHEVKALLRLNTNAAKPFLEIYRSARASKDVVAEFIGYYQTLDSVLGASVQADIDDYIEKKDPGVERSKKPPLTRAAKPRKVDTETVYSRLRNEIAHVRRDSNGKIKVGDVRKEVSQHVSTLGVLAAAAIEERLRENAENDVGGQA